MKIKRILIVEDDAFSRGAMEKILESHDYNTSSCATAEEAIVRLQEESFGVLITDLCMKKMDGLKLIREAKKIYPEILTILVTGLATEEVKLKVKEEGVNGFFSKPVEWDKLFALLEAFTKTVRNKGQNMEKNPKNKGYSTFQRGIFVIVILTLSLLTMFGIQLSIAQEQFIKFDRPPLRMDSQRCWKTPSVGLTEEQIKTLESLQRAYQVEIASKYREFIMCRIELQHYVSDKNTKPQDIIERHRRMLTLQTELENISLSYLMKARSILTQEQLERLPQDCLLEMGFGYGMRIGIGRGPRRGTRW